MSDFMGQHVGLRKLAGGCKASLQFVKKTQIDVDLFILRTIKGPCGGLRHATPRINGIAKQDKLGTTIPHIFRSQNFGPSRLRVIENERDELNLRLLRFSLFAICFRSRSSISLGDSRWPSTRAYPKQRKEIPMKQEAQNQEDQQSSNSQMDPAKLHTAGTALVAPIFYVITASTRSPAH